MGGLFWRWMLCKCFPKPSYVCTHNEVAFDLLAKYSCPTICWVALQFMSGMFENLKLRIKVRVDERWLLFSTWKWWPDERMSITWGEAQKGNGWCEIPVERSGVDRIVSKAGNGFSLSEEVCDSKTFSFDRFVIFLDVIPYVVSLGKRLELITNGS